MGSGPIRGTSFFLGKVNAFGVLCCFVLFVCLTLLASFFLSSFSSLINNMYVCTCPSRLEMSRCHACGLRNSECHTCACAPRAVGALARSRGSRTALDRARGLKETRAGPSGGGGRDRGIFKHRGRGQARAGRDFRVGDLEVTE